MTSPEGGGTVDGFPGIEVFVGDEVAVAVSVGVDVELGVGVFVEVDVELGTRMFVEVGVDVLVDWGGGADVFVAGTDVFPPPELVGEGMKI